MVLVLLTPHPKGGKHFCTEQLIKLVGSEEHQYCLINLQL